MPIDQTEIIAMATFTPGVFHDYVGRRIGPLAVHWRLYADPPCFGISHIATGHLLGPWSFFTASHAIRAAEALAKLSGWETIGTPNPSLDLAGMVTEMMAFFECPGLMSQTRAPFAKIANPIGRMDQ